MDQYEESLQKETERLKECLSKEGLSSCYSCPKVTEKCEIQQSYVKAVYKSMSKDSEGGFDF
jgi:hypothetical protein